MRLRAFVVLGNRRRYQNKHQKRRNRFECTHKQAAQNANSGRGRWDKLPDDDANYHADDNLPNQTDAVVPRGFCSGLVHAMLLEM